MSVLEYTGQHNQKELIVSETPVTPRFKLSQDWLATILGLALVALIGSGLLGPGPHRLTITAEPGETVTDDAATVDGWRVSATIGTDDNARTVLENLPVTLDDATDLTYTCDGGDGLTVTTTDAADSGDGVSAVTLANNCDQPVTVRLSIDAFFIWPLFGIFE